VNGAQLSIFDQPVIAPQARRRDPETSKEAAAKAASFTSHHRGLISSALAKGDGTIYELGDRAGLTHVQVARRMPELEQLGEAHPTKQRRSGCRIWARGPKP